MYNRTFPATTKITPRMTAMSNTDPENAIIAIATGDGLPLFPPLLTDVRFNGVGNEVGAEDGLITGFEKGAAAGFVTGLAAGIAAGLVAGGELGGLALSLNKNSAACKASVGSNSDSTFMLAAHDSNGNSPSTYKIAISLMAGDCKTIFLPPTYQ